MNYENINLNNLLPDHWKNLIDNQILNKSNNLLQKEILECKNNFYEIYPFNPNDIFKTFNLTPIENIKVVIIGQDPYHANKFQANGIAFSVNNKVIIPPSLRNIYKELSSNYPYNSTLKKDGNLSNWVEQGVFMLNASLTVKQKHPNSHVHVWEEFTTHIIDIISRNCDNVIFVAWGSYAFDKLKNINKEKHILLTSSHPSPLSCYKTEFPFIGSNVFLKINDILKNKNLKEINW